MTPERGHPALRWRWASCRSGAASNAGLQRMAQPFEFLE